MSSDPDLRLVLPHQLFEQHLGAPRGTVFLLIEHDLLFRQYSFHAHKLVLHRASMTRFARRLRAHGFDVEVLHSDAGRPSRAQLAGLLRRRTPATVSWYDVVDDWLEQDLAAALDDGGYRMRDADVLETPNFLTSRGQIDGWFGSNPARMHDFYVWQRRRLDLLIDGGGPVGGKWSFDAENRRKLPRGYQPATVGRFAHHPAVERQGSFDLEGLAEPKDDAGERAAQRDVAEAMAWVTAEFPDAPGDPTLFAWPTNADEARTTCGNSSGTGCTTSARMRTPSPRSIPSSPTACSPRP